MVRQVKDQQAADALEAEAREEEMQKEIKQIFAMVGSLQEATKPEELNKLLMTEL